MTSSISFPLKIVLLLGKFRSDCSCLNHSAWTSGGTRGKTTEQTTRLEIRLKSQYISICLAFRWYETMKTPLLLSPYLSVLQIYPSSLSFICFSLLYKHTYEYIIHWPTEKAEWRVRPENPRNCINTSVLEPTRQDGCIDQLVVSGDKTRDARRWQNCFISWSAAERAVANKWHNINKWPSDHHVSKVQKKQQCAWVRFPEWFARP